MVMRYPTNKTYLVVDTNILMKHLTLLNRLVVENENFTLVIPLIGQFGFSYKTFKYIIILVIKELDRLKKVTYKRIQATQALKWNRKILQNNLKDRTLWVTQEYQRWVSENYHAQSNDDKILAVARKLTECGLQVILLSDDLALQVNAGIHDVRLLLFKISIGKLY